MSKLYATATSEKASKGQGGNKFITVSIGDESKNIIAELQAVIVNKDVAQLRFIKHGNGYVNQVYLVSLKPNILFGNKNISEPCTWCNAEGCFHCDQKGKKQKDKVKICGTHATGTCPDDCMYSNY